MTTPVLAGVAYAYANWGRWVVDCPSPYCHNALAVRRFDPLYACVGPGSCGLTAPITWPLDPVTIERVLMARPSPTSRNWLPGETVMDLVAENADNALPAYARGELTTGATSQLGAR